MRLFLPLFCSLFCYEKYIFAVVSLCILLCEADSAAVLLLILLVEADFAAVWLGILT